MNVEHVHLVVKSSITVVSFFVTYVFYTSCEASSHFLLLVLWSLLRGYESCIFIRNIFIMLDVSGAWNDRHRTRPHLILFDIYEQTFAAINDPPAADVCLWSVYIDINKQRHCSFCVSIVRCAISINIKTINFRNENEKTQKKNEFRERKDPRSGWWVRSSYAVVKAFETFLAKNIRHLLASENLQRRE